jgi:hypothetical protein
MAPAVSARDRWCGGLLGRVSCGTTISRLISCGVYGNARPAPLKFSQLFVWDLSCLKENPSKRREKERSTHACLIDLDKIHNAKSVFVGDHEVQRVGKHSPQNLQ